MSEASLPTVTLSTDLAPDQVNAILKQSCRAEASATLVAHDPMRLPQLRIYEMVFASPEERDRFLIAMRMREQSAAPSQARAAKSALKRA